ncbi:MAG: hypothetical protein KBF88_08755 [Polyangiaceae bacterium]|nr:hypothetical protein [Polyangiaceae bacterium]
MQPFLWSSYFVSAYLFAWLRAFLFTQAIEMPIYRRMLNVSWPRAFLATMLTHPFVWFVFPLLEFARVETPFGIHHFPSLPRVVWLPIAEAFAVIVETGAMKFRSERSWLLSALASVLANVASVLLGEISRALFGYP